MTAPVTDRAAVGGAVVLGVQAAQIPSNAVRGIARYIREHAVALTRSAPDVLQSLRVDPRLPIPDEIDGLRAEVPVRPFDDPPDGRSTRTIFHVMSPIEAVAIDRLWPAWARLGDVGLVVTVFDLTPLRYPHDYFAGPLRRLLDVRMEMVRAADAVLAISESTASDVVDLLEVDRARVHTIRGGASERFRPAEEPLDHALGALHAQLPRLRPGFLFFAANIDRRKNIDGLLRAYALLRPETRRRHQLVVTCSQADDAYLADLEAGIRAQALDDDVLIAGHVPDDALIRLFQRCALFVYPSLFEGLGLPLIEAMRCGAVAIASDTSSMRELVVDPRARFDPSSPRSIADAIERALDDDELRRTLLASARCVSAEWTWAEVSRRSIAGYRAAMERRWGAVA